VKKTTILLAAFALIGGIAVAQDAPKLILDARLSANLVTADLADTSTASGIALGGQDNIGAELKTEKFGAAFLLVGSLANPGSVAIDDYYGWMKFDALKLTFGETDLRCADRAKKDESSWGTFEPFKYGALRNGKTVKESDNIALWKGAEAAAELSLGDFQIALGTGTDTVAPVSKGAITDAKTNAYDVRNAFAARVAYTVPETVKFNATVVKYGESNLSVGAFANLLLVKGLSAVVGYSGAIDLKTSANSVHAVEFRARYAADGLAITTHNNFSFADGTNTLYDMVNVAYKINDTFTPNLFAMNLNYGTTNVFMVRPCVTVFAAKGATIDVGPEFTMTNVGSVSHTVVTMPVVLRVVY